MVFYHKNNKVRHSVTKTMDLGQQGKALAAKPEDLNLIPGIHRMEGTDSYKLSSDFHTHSMAIHK